MTSLRRPILPDDDPPPPTPGWLVTYADLVTLLMACFMMLVSMSELREPARYEALLKAMRRQFGAGQGIGLGHRPSARAALARISVEARSRRQELLGLDRTGRDAILRLTLADDAAKLSSSQEQQLDRFLDEALASAAPIEVAAYAPLVGGPASPAVARQALSRAQEHAGTVVESLIARGIGSRRIRVQALLSSPPSPPDSPSEWPDALPESPAAGTAAVDVRLKSGP